MDRAKQVIYNVIRFSTFLVFAGQYITLLGLSVKLIISIVAAINDIPTPELLPDMDHMGLGVILISQYMLGYYFCRYEYFTGPPFIVSDLLYGLGYTLLSGSVITIIYYSNSAVPTVFINGLLLSIISSWLVLRFIIRLIYKLLQNNT